jgi:hypothetical protein
MRGVHLGMCDYVGVVMLVEGNQEF